MQVVKTGFFIKTNVAVSSAIRDTSCSRGWLRLVVQIIFGLITVASFIMILVMALQRNPVPEVPVETRRCSATSCRVVCSNAPFYENYVNEIAAALSNIESECSSGISLTLNRPSFTNSTIPKNWMSKISSKVIELSIVGGNLRYIQADTFMSSFASNIEELILEDIKLIEFGVDALVGLSGLLQLDLRDCQIRSIHRNALRAVDETLQSLYVRSSGYWNPANLTGSSELTELLKVDFSSNEFGSVLGRESFRQLEQCEELRLSSSRIISIGMGTFDFMVNIQRIYLNNNFLVSLPARIFDRITALAVDPKPSIDLQDNLWRCDCYIEHLRVLQTEGFLMLDPSCDTPYELYGRRFSSFDTFCCVNHVCNHQNPRKIPNVTQDLIPHTDERNVRIHDSLYIDGSCPSARQNTRYLHGLQSYRCVTNRAYFLPLDALENISREAKPNADHYIIAPKFYMESPATSLLELKTSSHFGHDLLWFQTNCLSEIFCTDSLPEYLRIYNINVTSTYIFCSVDQGTGILAVNNCVAYLPSSPSEPPARTPSSRLTHMSIVLYIATVIFSIVLGAVCLYTIIRRNPTLLRGSKRILLVKHKAVEALVLPPRIPTRNEFLKDNNTLLPNLSADYGPRNIDRSISMRSSKSNSPSYISALQPTEAQLAEWRLKNHFNNDSGVSSNQHISIESGLISYIYDGESIYYSD